MPNEDRNEKKCFDEARKTAKELSKIVGDSAGLYQSGIEKSADAALIGEISKSKFDQCMLKGKVNKSR